MAPVSSNNNTIELEKKISDTQPSTSFISSLDVRCKHTVTITARKKNVQKVVAFLKTEYIDV